jgi:hypothetical protein
MKIPTTLYGVYKTVCGDVRWVVTRLKKGGSLGEALGAEAFLDTDTAPGEIFLQNPYPGEGIQPAFYVSILGDLLLDATDSPSNFSPDREEALFHELLHEPWGLATILGRNNAQFWLMHNPERLQPYLEALEHHRSVLDAVGGRFSGGTQDEHRPWWSIPGGPIYALANLGVVRAELDGLMESGTIPAWRRTRQAVAGD